ncbi:hypothetical protein RUM44_000447 [Polyplax serrata]|uniref:Cardioactive peptide n=1 Tax=Polyplax serrata TaxID=468196 RepID=A0ABR1B5F8_POLSC
MGPIQIHPIAAYSIAVLYIIALTVVSGDDVILQKRSERNRLDMDRFLDEDRPRKRPFCNAFTGCGKKRSDESMANLVDINPEPAMDDLSKQILSEAKLWEALQIARAELERRHQGRQNVLPMDMPLGAAISNFRRKRSPVKTDEINLLQAGEGNPEGRQR